MTLQIPSNRKQIYDKISSDVKANLPNTNPQKEKSWLRSILAGFSGIFFDLYESILEAIDTFFASTTYDDINDPTATYLTKKASDNGIFRLAATGSSGTIAFTGTLGTAIPAGTLLTGNSNSVQYETLNELSITLENISITLLTYTNNVATATTTTDHNLVIGSVGTITGASPVALSGAFSASSILADNIFQFPTTLSGSGTASGTIVASIERAIVPIQSSTQGLDTNLNLNEDLTLSSPIVGIDNVAVTTYDGLAGGTDIETDESLRERLVFKLQNPATMFNAIQIELTLKELNWVDRVFVEEITPDVGQVTIYILKEDNVLPGATEIQEAKDKIEDDILPANTWIDDVIISAPSQVSVSFTFTSISPDTTTMRTSITNRLQEFFNNNTDIGVDITENEYISAIQTTIDLENGQELQSFVLSSPSGDITIASGEIGAFGGVSF